MTFPVDGKLAERAEGYRTLHGALAAWLGRQAWDRRTEWTVIRRGERFLVVSAAERDATITERSS